MTNAVAPIKLVVLISGGGTNLQALIDGQQRAELPIAIVGVISNRPDVKGLTRAAAANIPTQVVDHQHFTNREEFEQALVAAIDFYQPDLIVLAGFMRILSPTFTQRYLGRMFNIHPSLLPKYPGLHTHERALAAGDTEHGATVHFVTAELDGGPIIIQTKVPVLSTDTPASLAARVLEQEHRIYPQAIRWFAEGRLRLVGSDCTLDGKLLPSHDNPIAS
jgi:phosphoribosylglycinamide formyltransferase 1